MKCTLVDMFWYYTTSVYNTQSSVAQRILPASIIGSVHILLCWPLRSFSCTKLHRWSLLVRSALNKSQSHSLTLYSSELDELPFPSFQARSIRFNFMLSRAHRTHSPGSYHLKCIFFLDICLSGLWSGRESPMLYVVSIIFFFVIHARRVKKTVVCEYIRTKTYIHMYDIRDDSNFVRF